MTEVRPFNQDRIIEHLRSRDLRYKIDDDGDLRVMFDHEDMEIAVFPLVRGKAKAILSMVSIRTREFRRKEWIKILHACNQWNSQKRWPTAYLNADDFESDETGYLQTEWNVDLGPGVHQELLGDMIDTFIGCSMQFWEWLRDEHFIL